MSLHIFGVRHHGPGSARSLLAALESARPDAILVEGPPDADHLLPLVTHPSMEPPVALLVYVAAEPQKAVFYPFAAFSPEWHALRFGLNRGLNVRFIDLPQAHQLALPQTESDQLNTDPLQKLAEAAGFSDGELWWEQMIEERRGDPESFAAIKEAMAALRSSLPERNDEIEARREAFMRQAIRAARKDGFERIAVVCGAWHAPALDLDAETAPSANADAALLKGLPKIKVQATWIPWTNGRLSAKSGYGAGVQSPGWYQHLWETPDQVSINWLARVSQLLRAEDLDVSPAHLIEATRLAEALAAMRHRSSPGLAELNEATQAVLCFGEDAPLQLIRSKLIVGEAFGQVPEETPLPPLQQDLNREQKRLRLLAEASERLLDLDLRKATDLDRSRLLHRLGLIGVDWGELQRSPGKTSTFHEIWRLLWRPEFTIKLIEAGVWGKTIGEAATSHSIDLGERADALPAVTTLLDRVLPADLPEAVDRLMIRLQAMAALAGDAGQLMDALPPLAAVARYGNVRRTDSTMVGQIVAGLVARICIGLPGACASLNDEAAREMFARINQTNGAVALLQIDEHSINWRAALNQLGEQNGLHVLHGLIAGRCCRLLLDAKALASDEAARRLNLALSTATEPASAAAWIEGFLKESGLILLHDETLWRVLDEWVTGLPGETFTPLLPLLRRTFATFSAPERRQIGERVRRGRRVDLSVQSSNSDFDQARAEAALPIVARLLGLTLESQYRER